ncbi:MAG: phytanoyl-CoA dioxygenase family protein [Pirellula sp.]
MTEDEKFRFDNDGLIVIEDVMSLADCEVAKQKIDSSKQVSAKNPDGVPTGGLMQMKFNVFELGHPFICLIDNSRVCSVLKTVIAPKLRIEHAYSFVYECGAPPLELHAGDPKDWAAYHYVVQNGQIHAGLCVVSFVLQDIAEEDGGFVFVPGSHKRNFYHGQLDFRKVLSLDSAQVRAVAAPAGSAIIFTETLIHGARRWNRPDARYGLFFKYNDRSCRHIHSRNMLCDDATLRGMSPEQRCFFNPVYASGGPNGNEHNFFAADEY